MVSYSCKFSVGHLWKLEKGSSYIQFETQIAQRKANALYGLLEYSVSVLKCVMD